MSELVVRHVTQPSANTCVHACLAMVTGVGVWELVERFGDQGLGWQEEIAVLVENRIFPVWMTLQLPNPFGFRGVYLVTVSSLNLLGRTHRVVVEQTGQELILHDPNWGRDGVAVLPAGAMHTGEVSWSEVMFLDTTALHHMATV